MKKKSSKATKAKTTQFCFPVRTIEELIRETDFKSIRDEIAKIDREKQWIRKLYLANKHHIQYGNERETQGQVSSPLDFFDVSYTIQEPRLIYSNGRFEWQRRTEAWCGERKIKFFDVENTNYPNMVLKVEIMVYCLMKKPEPEKKHGFLHKPYCPSVYKKEDFPELFKNETGSFCLVKCEFPTKITLGYLVDEKFRKEKAPYRILVVSDAEKVEYLMNLEDECELLESSSCQHPIFVSSLFDDIFPPLSDMIKKFEKDKTIAKQDIKFINEIKCFCEFKIDPVLMFLVSIIESFLNVLLAHRLINVCEYCGDFFSYKKRKKHCSLFKEGKDCGNKARKKRGYERHKAKRLQYYTEEMKITRKLLKTHGVN